MWWMLKSVALCYLMTCSSLNQYIAIASNLNGKQIHTVMQLSAEYACNLHMIIIQNFTRVCVLLMLQTDRHEAVLSMALEHGLIGFIVACISQWSTAGDDVFSSFNTATVHVWFLYCSCDFLYSANKFTNKWTKRLTHSWSLDPELIYTLCSKINAHIFIFLITRSDVNRF